jgi:hypothetical protein
LEDHTLTWQGDCTVVDVAQWLAATWPSHGLPRGSGKMPNDIPRTNLKNIYIKRFGRSDKSGGTPPNLAPTDLYITTVKSGGTTQYIYIYIYVCVYVTTNKPKGEACGLDSGTSPSINALTYALR